MGSGVPVALQTASSYLRGILDRERVDDSAASPLRALTPRVERIVRAWGGRHLMDVQPSGAFEKGTANASGMRIDFLASVHPAASFSSREIYESLYHALDKMGLRPEARNVSIGVTLGGVQIDIIPARRDNLHTEEHWLYSALRGKAFVTDLHRHVLEAVTANRRDEVRVLKLWRDRNHLVFPSYYLESTVAAALRGRPRGELSDNVWAVLGYLESHFVARSLLDPANAHNIVSDELDLGEKARIRTAAKVARSARSWHDMLS
jgi:hypothetical protein